MPLRQLANYKKKKKKLYEMTQTPLIVTLRNFNFKCDLGILLCKKEWNAWKAPCPKFN